MTTTKKRRRIVPRGPNHRTSSRQLAFLQNLRNLVDLLDGETPSIGQIADHVGRSKSTVHDMLVRLERRGLVEAIAPVGAANAPGRWRPASPAGIAKALATEYDPCG